MAEKKKKDEMSMENNNVTIHSDTPESKKIESGLKTGNNSIVISGNVNGNSIIMGSNNNVSVKYVNLTPLFGGIYSELNKRTDLKPEAKNDIKAELHEIQTALEGSKPDENFITRRFRNIERMAPDIVDVAFETLKNPVSGVATLIQKIAKKMADISSS
jgi:hypothetical protein